MSSKSLRVDESRKYEVPSLLPGIIRTGTVGEGSCLFHAILKGIDKSYSDMSPSEKRKYMVDYRKYLASLFSFEYYIKKLKVVSNLYLILSLNQFLTTFYRFVDQPSPFLKKEYEEFFGKLIKENIVAFSIFTNVIPLKKKKGYVSIEDITEDPFLTFSENVIEYKERFLLTLSERFRQEISKFGLGVSEEKIQICITKIQSFFEFLFMSILDKNYQSYKKEIESTSCWGGDNMLKLISEIIDKDIYFIDINKREVYNKGCDEVVSGKRNAVIIGWINESHFESIGYSPSGKLDDIIREFPPDHPLIQKIRQIICD